VATGEQLREPQAGDRGAQSWGLVDSRAEPLQEGVNRMVLIYLVLTCLTALFYLTVQRHAERRMREWKPPPAPQPMDPAATVCVRHPPAVIEARRPE